MTKNVEKLKFPVRTFRTNELFASKNKISGASPAVPWSLPGRSPVAPRQLGPQWAAWSPNGPQWGPMGPHGPQLGPHGAQNLENATFASPGGRSPPREVIKNSILASIMLLVAGWALSRVS